MFFNSVFHSCCLKIYTCFLATVTSFYSLSDALICNLFKCNKSPRLRTFAKNLKSTLKKNLLVLKKYLFE